MALHEFTSARSGTGKTFRRCAHFLAEDWLPNYVGCHISNFPLISWHRDRVTGEWDRENPDESRLNKLIDYVMSKHKKLDRDRLRARIHVIPPWITETWRCVDKGKPASGPWDYFPENISDEMMQGAKIAFDEIHNFVHTKNASEAHKGKWASWMGELRHQGVMSAEYISQYETKVATCIRNESGLRRTLFNCEDRHNPFYGGRHGDWYELVAGYTGSYRPLVIEIEEIEKAGKWVSERPPVRFRLGPPYFDFYDSYSAPQAGGAKADGAPNVYKNCYPVSLPGGEVEAAKWTKGDLWRWFLRRNSFGIVWRAAALCVFVWLSVGGGHAKLAPAFFTFFQSLMPAPNQAVDQVDAEKAHSGALAQSPLTPKAPILANDVSGLEAPPILHNGIGYVPLAKLQQAVAVARALEDKMAELEKRTLEHYTINLLQPDSVTFKNGETYAIGELISFGPYAGSRVDLIDYQRRRIMIGDKCVWLGR